ncbi:MAG TPA: J domain-containing protein [Xanthobacteraceae bacterium]|nr:J domain-containing protein [Xanthobacteraceae bacterium]
MKTFYDLLGVRPNADNATIRAAFRKAVKGCHPDAKAGDRTAEKRFMEITAAHAVLRDPERRADYDRALERRRQKLLREWKITLVGWGLSAVMSAGAVSAGVLVLPKWLGTSNLVAASFATRFPTVKGDAAKPAVAAMATPSGGTARPSKEVNAAPLASGQTAQEGEDKQHDPAPLEQTVSTSAPPGSGQPALVDTGAPAVPAGAEERPAGGESGRPPSNGGPAATRGVDRNREARLAAYLVGRDRLAESLLRTHIFEPDEVEQILGFVEASPDQPPDELSPERFHHGVKHHHHRERRTAFRRGRIPRG